MICSFMDKSCLLLGITMTSQQTHLTALILLCFYMMSFSLGLFSSKFLSNSPSSSFSPSSEDHLVSVFGPPSLCFFPFLFPSTISPFYFIYLQPLYLYDSKISSLCSPLKLIQQFQLPTASFRFFQPYSVVPNC